MSPIPSLGSKISVLFKGKKKADVSAPESSASSSQKKDLGDNFDASKPMQKTFAAINKQMSASAKPAPKSPTDVQPKGLPSVEALAKRRGHAAPVAASETLTARELSPATRHLLTAEERKAHHERMDAIEIANCKTPESRAVAINVEPFPEGWDFNPPKKPGVAGKSILKRTFEGVYDPLPRIDEKAPLKVHTRQGSMASFGSSDGGALSRTVSFDHQTDSHQMQLSAIREEKEMVEAFKRQLNREAANASRAKKF